MPGLGRELTTQATDDLRSSAQRKSIRWYSVKRWEERARLELWSSLRMVLWQLLGYTAGTHTRKGLQRAILGAKLLCHLKDARRQPSQQRPHVICQSRRRGARQRSAPSKPPTQRHPHVLSVLATRYQVASKYKQRTDTAVRKELPRKHRTSWPIGRGHGAARSGKICTRST